MFILKRKKKKNFHQGAPPSIGQLPLVKWNSAYVNIQTCSKGMTPVQMLLLDEDALPQSSIVVLNC